MAEHDDVETGTDQHRGFGAMNVPLPVAPTFDGAALDASASAEPEPEVSEPEAVPDTASVRKTRRPAGAAPASEPEDWAVVLETQDEQELARIAQELERGGIRAELEIASDVSLMRGMERTYGVVVPTTEADLARALIEESQEYVELLDAVELEEEPGDELFLLHERVAADMPGATKRRRAREYRRRRKALRAEYGSGRQTPVSVLVVVVLGVIVIVTVLTAVVG